MARVAARVARGGHAIDPAKVRARYDSCRANLVRLIPHLQTLRVFDNSAEHDPARGEAPTLVLVLHAEAGTIYHPCDAQSLALTPEWAKPLVAAARRHWRCRWAG